MIKYILQVFAALLLIFGICISVIEQNPSFLFFGISIPLIIFELSLLINKKDK